MGGDLVPGWLCLREAVLRPSIVGDEHSVWGMLEHHFFREDGRTFAC